jgi:class 3 adenylate cyclase
VEQPVARAEYEPDGDVLEFAGYVPALVARHFVDRREPLDGPESERFPAAVLFADISGFTDLTERLAGTGPNGVEELTELLNDCFGQLVELIGEYGGEVVKFAGDALLAIWVPSVDGAATRLPSTWPVAPARSRSASSIHCPPARPSGSASWPCRRRWPGAPPRSTCSSKQLPEHEPLGQGGGQDETGVGGSAVVVEADRDRVGAVG